MTTNTELIGCVQHDCAKCKAQEDAIEALKAQLAAAQGQSPIGWVTMGEISFKEPTCDHKTYTPVYAAPIPQQPTTEPEVWFCPDCGTISETQTRCCPDWIRSRRVTKNFAETCKRTFDAALQAQPERAPSDDPLQGAVDWFLQADGEFFCVATVQRTLRIGYNRAKRLCDIAKERAAIKQGGQHD